MWEKDCDSTNNKRKNRHASHHGSHSASANAYMCVHQTQSKPHTLNNARRETQTFENYLTFFYYYVFFFYRSAAFFFFAGFFCLFRLCFSSRVFFSASSLILILILYKCIRMSVCVCLCVVFLCILIILIAHSVREQCERVWPYSKWHRENVWKSEKRNEQRLPTHTHTHTCSFVVHTWRSQVEMKWVEKLSII